MDDNLFSKINQGLSHCLPSTGASSLSTIDNQLLTLKRNTIVDLGTLPQSSWLSHQYLQLNHKDLVLLNDPYSGNSHLQSMTLVAGLRDPLTNHAIRGDNKSQFLLAHRFWFKPRVIHTLNIDEEGVRIPPTPLYHEGQFNQQLLDGVSAHPLSPPGFSDRVQTETKKLLQHIDLLSPMFRSFELTESELRAYLRESKKRFIQLVEGFRHTETYKEHKLTDGSYIKLAITMKSSKVIFDFSGTEESKVIALTDGATVSACLYSLYQFLPSNTPINSGILQNIEVITPTQSTVSAKFPRSVFLGMTEGVQWLSHFILQSLQEFASDGLKLAESPSIQSSFEIQFQSGQIFYDDIQSGQGATNFKNGLPGTNIENRLDLNPCLEKIEALYPLRFQSITERIRSGGSGHYQGGNGLSKFIDILEAGTLRWSTFEPLARPQGVEGGQAGASLEFYVLRSGEKISLIHEKQFSLKKGDTLAILSPGGGGFGQLKPS
ncbi:MAG: hydantoinase B/oxoprolinase family protein [Bdellovibrionales bacterium]|nr:hydantoinase B/oxoprolinase family protein [Bdellovibrionales bacterium]